MAWTGLNLTADGRKALNNAQLSGRMQIKAIAVGDGAPPADFQMQKSLVNQLYEITDIKIDKTENGCTLTVDFPKLDYDYYFREIGVIVDTEEGEVLYVYDNCGNDAQYIVSSAGVESTRKRIRLSLIISDVEKIAVSNPSVLYVAYDDFERAAATFDSHMDDFGNPHNVTKAQVGLGETDNTADMDKPVSTAQQTALDAYYQQSTGYTDTKIAQLINGAPSTLDTLGEIAAAMKENEGVVGALEAAIGSKANEAEFDSHVKDAVKHITVAERTKWNGKMEVTGDSANNTVTFASSDAAEATGWTDIGVVASGEKHSSLFPKVSLAIKNLRYLWKVLGTTSLKGIGDGTVTGAINELNTGITGFRSYILESSNETWTQDLIQFYNSIPSKCNFNIYLNAGWVGRVSGIKGNSEFGYMILYRYNTLESPISILGICIIGGIWSSWVSIYPK